MKRYKILLAVLFPLSLAFACQGGDPAEEARPLDPSVPVTKDVTVVIEDEIKSIPVVLVGNARKNFIVSYDRRLDGETLHFQKVSDPLPVIMRDDSGTLWNIFGEAVEGPKKGARLQTVDSFMGYWFAFGTFYPGVEIYPSNDRGEFAGEKITGNDQWLVPPDEVRDAGPGIDGIPALEEPDMISASEINYLNDNDLVIGVKVGDEMRAYPHEVLDWHEIINDDISGTAYAVVYCPLTGTATVWERNILNQTTTFGVSGLLYNSNIMPYDRASRSYWSQLMDKVINGTLKGTSAKNIRVVETTWATWRLMYPESKVLSLETGHNRNYGQYPYGSYKTNGVLLFPVKYQDNRIFSKERVHGIVINQEARVYRFQSFVEQD